MNNINSAVFVSLAYFDGKAHLPELNFGQSFPPWSQIRHIIGFPSSPSAMEGYSLPKG
jgi:hypothetical protein